MNIRGVRWLYGELPLLVEKGVISAEGADRIRSHYGPIPQVSRTKLTKIVLSVAGASLVALGLLQVVAHNWDYLPQDLRLTLAFLPLLIAQGLCAFTIWRRYDSIPWREAGAILCAAGVGISLALVSQIYHLYPDLEGFLFWWVLAALPLVVILNATSAAVAAAGLATGWVCIAREPFLQYVIYPLMLAPVLFHLGLALRKRPEHPRSIILLCVLPVCLFALTVRTVFFMRDAVGQHWAMAFGSLFSIYLLAGLLFFRGRERTPLIMYGSAGLSVVLYVASINGVWDNGRLDWSLMAWSGLGYPYFLVAVAAVLFAVAVQRRLPVYVLLWTASFIPLTAAFFYDMSRISEPGLLISAAINLYILVLSVATLAEGLRRDKLLLVNGGLAVLTILVAIRFFGQDFTYLARGIAFAGVGALFLVVNMVLMRRRAQPEGRPA